MVGVRTVLKDEPAGNPEYSLLVAVANPDHVAQLMRTATDLVRGRDGEIVVTSVVHKPFTSPFLLFAEDHIGAEFDGGCTELLDRAAALAEGVPTRRHLLVGHDVSSAILAAADDANASALLIGWQNRLRPSDIVLGTTVDPVVRRAPCDVFVERVGTTADGLESILLPTVGGPHLEPAANLVSAIANSNDADVLTLAYVPPDAGAEERSAARDHVDQAVALLSGASVEGDVRETEDVASAIVEVASDHDLVVLGATRERGFRRRVVGSVAEVVTREADPPVIVTRGKPERLLDPIRKRLRV